ncbi:MAG TPA: hypothetical protein PK079_16455 [Leptospiraceae bacterium]|nr:hypothetical protein [Leptospiraceae bacterium]HMW05507.1 hypothetical protein [Leptospiraceae bacterium]HMX32466.1 hypothetical protein [Leptospiraceae bacterium]HMY31017.1 hypothetical protein [Leptospiraceae bacterium]HMZ65051.1 hypothetical protein [Leptospiraceae bacterium]
MNDSKSKKYSRQILFLILILALFGFTKCTNELRNSGLGPKKKNNNVQLQFLSYVYADTLTNLGVNSRCARSSGTIISNPAVANPNSTVYNLRNCNINKVDGFSTNRVTSSTTGFVGTSTSSLIVSNGSQVGTDGTGGKRNAEVTFTVNSSSGYLDVIVYGDGNTNSFSGPTWRITSASNQFKDQNGSSSNSQIAYRSQDGVFRVPISGATPSLPANPIRTVSTGSSRTICLDFFGSSNTLQAAWDGSCTSVATSQKSTRSSYPILIDPADANLTSSSFAPQTTVGTKIGFILNNITLTSFTIANQLAQE